MPANLNVPDGIPEASAATCAFRLYVAGEAPNSILALRNLMVFSQAHYGEDCRIEVVDVLLSPERAWKEGAIVTPMLVRTAPEPVVKIIGNLSNTQQVLHALGLGMEKND